MKNLYLYIGLLLYGITAFAQNENNHWQLGPSDLNFSTNPVTINTNSAVPTGNYGLASVSDASGNLLFYSDGVNIWNKNHGVIATIGYTLQSYDTAMPIIVPDPGNIYRYYVFYSIPLSTGSTDPEGPLSPYVYCVVDFTNNNLGELALINPSVASSTLPSAYETKYTVFLKKVSTDNILHRREYAPITSAINSAGTGYWVIVQSESSMYSFSLTTTGLSTTPVTSTFASGTIYHYSPDNGGYSYGIKACTFRMSPDYSNTSNLKLYALEYSLNPHPQDLAFFSSVFHSLNFNQSTGIFSGYQDIPLSATGNDGSASAQSFEISNDYQKAYFVRAKNLNSYYSSYTNKDGEVRVLDLSTGSDRLLYEYSSPTTATLNFVALQKDKYGNMLLSGKTATSDRNKYLHIINNQNSYSGSSVQTNYVYLNGNSVSYFPQSVLHITPPCAGDIALTATETAVNKLYKSNGTITAGTNYLVNSGSNVTLYAQTAIYLNPNTEIGNGATFVAEIRPCSQGRPSGTYDNDDSEDNNSIITTNASTKLYPNPNSGTFEIALGSVVSGGVGVEVYDITGKVVYNTVSNEARFNVAIPNLAAGMYLVRLLGTNYNETIKFIKQ